MRNEDHISFLKWTSNWLGIAPLTLFWRPILVENPAFWPNPPFWTGFQPVSSLHNRRYFFSRFCRRAKASAKWVRSTDKRDEEDVEKAAAVHIPLFFCIPPQTYPLMALLTRFALAFAPASGLNCLRSPEKRTPVMQASQLAWHGNGWKRDLQHKTAQFDVH